MQTKTITKVIQAKINDWIESINDTELRHELKKCVLVSGGSIANMYLDQQVNDYDVYLQDRNVLIKLCEYYTKPFSDDILVIDGNKKSKFLEAHGQGFSHEDFIEHTSHAASVYRNLKQGQVKLFIEDKNGGYKVENVDTEKKYQPVFFSPNAISLSDDIQIVNRFFGTPEEIHKTFDFIHATNYWTFDSGCVINLQAIESLLTKQLRYQGSLYPVTSIIRVKKFVKRGFNIGAGDMLKMIFQSSLLDLTDMDVLEDQLIGVDVAYFGTVIAALRNHKADNPEFKLTAPYFMELIDRVFNRVENDN